MTEDMILNICGKISGVEVIPPTVSTPVHSTPERYPIQIMGTNSQSNTPNSQF